MDIASFSQTLKNRLAPVYQKAAFFIQNHFPQILSYAILLIVIVMTFKLQNTIVGWEPGYDELQPKHHGWVSSQGLAIIASATTENHFVGTAIQSMDADGNLVYDYFDRYPVFFSAIFNQILELRPKLSSKIYLAKQVMNLIFLATLLVAFLILDKLIKNKPLALSATLIAFSNPFLMFYKDMVHFDQPALFGFLLLIYGITLYKLDDKKIPAYIATLIAVALGRGYASFAVLGVWALLEAILILKTKGLTFGLKIVAILKHLSFRLAVIGVLWGAALLSYNVVIEAQTRNVSWMETSILTSAQRRLSLNDEFIDQYDYVLNWPYFLKNQVDRIIQWTYPINKVNLGVAGNVTLLIGMFVIMGIVVRRQPLEKRILYLVLMLSGFFWLIPMRSLSAFHDYTSMFYIGFSLVFFVSIILLLKPSKEASYYLAIIGMVIYLAAITNVGYWHRSLAGDANEYTYDFMHIADQLDGEGNQVYLADGIPYGPYADRFYLSDQYLAPEDQADYIITINPDYSPNNLTPDNTFFFLYKK